MQKFIISSKTLKSALDKLGQAVNSKSVVPALSNILCKAGAGEVIFSTSDLELSIQYRCECEVLGDPFDMLIPYAFIKQVVGLSKHAPIEVVLSDGRAKITGSAGDIYELNALTPVSDFPNIPALPKKNSIVMDDVTISWLHRALLTVSVDDARPQMTKVCLDMSGDSMTMASTDAQSMFTHTFPIQSKSADQLLISHKIAKALEGFESAEVYWNNKHIGFHSENITVIATRQEDKYPNYKGVIPDYTANLTLQRSDLVDALQRCCLSSSSNKSTVVHLKEQDGLIRFVSDDPDYSRKIQVEITGSYTGPVEKFAINAQKLLTIMRQIDYDQVSLHIHNATKAILISSESDAGYLGLLMPISFN